MIFTVSPDAPFASYNQDSMVFEDAKLSIVFETQEMLEETLLLLRFNCPDSDCAYIGNGWGDLKLHVRASHGKLIWYVLDSLRPSIHSHHVFTWSAICVSGTKRSSLMNMHCILRIFSPYISPRYTTDRGNLCQKIK